MSTHETLSLEDIPGLGPVRRQALAEAGIQNLEALLRTRVAELASIRGIGIWQARKIREYLRQRGLVLAEDQDGSVVLANARTPAEVETVAQAVQAIEETAAREAEVEEEVELLVHALEEARSELADAESGPPSADDGAAPADEEPGETAEEPVGSDEEPVKAAESAETDEEDGLTLDEEEAEEEARQTWQEEIRAQRERLPETALTLMEAIRQAAVTRQLTRQVTRLLITAGEFAADSHELSPRKQRRASEALAQVEQALQRAVEKRAFRPADQKDLADRIRRRRKELEKLLEGSDE